MAEVRPIDANSIHYTRVLAQKGLDMELAAKSSIEKMPTLDYEPVKHSEWVKAGGFTVCKECGCSPADWEAKPDNPSGLPPFCHSCGAKMDGGKNE